MSDEQVWNDQTRRELRERLRSRILGELRLAKREHEEILQTCREVYIQDECPARELDAFLQFATDELERGESLLASERVAWPEVTDCDRLDCVEEALRDKGILLWQVSPCCDSCTGGELPDRIDVIDEHYPGFRDRLRGYAFFIDQNLPDILADGTHVSVYLAYGWFSPDSSEVAANVYAENALGIAREVCDSLRDEGFEADWDGTLSRKIGISLNWQRRKMLE